MDVDTLLIVLNALVAALVAVLGGPKALEAMRRRNGAREDSGVHSIELRLERTGTQLDTVIVHLSDCVYTLNEVLMLVRLQEQRIAEIWEELRAQVKETKR